VTSINHASCNDESEGNQNPIFSLWILQHFPMMVVQHVGDALYLDRQFGNLLNMLVQFLNSEIQKIIIQAFVIGPRTTQLCSYSSDCLQTPTIITPALLGSL
jgi:hypothetical protein